MKRCPAAHLIDLLFPLALFCAFAVTSLLVVVVGADVYRRTTDEMDRNFALRTPLAYLSQAVHRTDLAGGISIGPVWGRAGADPLRNGQRGGIPHLPLLPRRKSL